jgi:hypothetical protein
MSRQTLSGLVNRDAPRAFPRQHTLAALAKGLGVSVEAVRQVAAEAAYGNGHVGTQRALVGVVTAHAEGLTDPELEVVLATMRALKKLPEHAVPTA